MRGYAGYARFITTGTVTSLDWDLIDNWTTAQACNLQATTTTKQKRKVEHLQGIQHPGDQMDANKVVINLSSKDLEPAAVSILSKGLNGKTLSRLDVHIHVL
jgi:hypothetical protein